MKVAVGSDHRGFNAKQLIKAIVSQMGHECVDVGTNNATPVDYPDLAYVAAKIRVGEAGGQGHPDLRHRFGHEHRRQQGPWGPRRLVPR